MTGIGALTTLGVPKGIQTPNMGYEGVRIWISSFSDSLVPTKAKTAKKSILAQKSHGSCFLNIPYCTTKWMTSTVTVSSWTSRWLSSSGSVCRTQHQSAIYCCVGSTVFTDDTVWNLGVTSDTQLTSHIKVVMVLQLTRQCGVCADFVMQYSSYRKPDENQINIKIIIIIVIQKF